MNYLEEKVRAEVAALEAWESRKGMLFEDQRARLDALRDVLSWMAEGDACVVASKASEEFVNFHKKMQQKQQKGA